MREYATPAGFRAAVEASLREGPVGSARLRTLSGAWPPSNVCWCA